MNIDFVKNKHLGFVRWKTSKQKNNLSLRTGALYECCLKDRMRDTKLDKDNGAHLICSRYIVLAIAW